MEITLNGSGIRDTGRVLGINKNTVTAVLKKMKKINSYFLIRNESDDMNQLEVDIRFDGEADKFWGFVQSKANQRWTWYAIDRKSDCILAWHNGKRQDKDFLEPWKLLEQFSISCYHTDNWGPYSNYIPKERHRIGKDRTWKIERKNLNFRTHIKRFTRKMICFSKSGQIHDNVIEMYIEKFYYKIGTYGNNRFN